MISKEHNKHSKIAKAGYGFFNRNEWAIVGTTCDTVKTLAGTIIEAMTPLYKCGYADAKHNKNDEETDLPGQLAQGAFAEFSEETNYRQFNFNTSLNQFHLRQLFAQADLMLVNGNHFDAKAQILVIDERKKESLKKRIAQTTNVQMILLANGEHDIYDFVKEAVPGWKQLPIHRSNDYKSIIEFFRDKLALVKPTLNGLVLAGGKSLRMGFDKSLIDWHGKEQKYFMADLLKSLCNEVYISSNEEDAKHKDEYKIIKDSFIGLGPYGAILSAFREEPDKAWLIVACDQPLLDAKTLQFLKDNRNTSSMATTFQSTFTDLPEPLVAIWEPRGYPVLLSFLAQGINCPRKVLINNYNVSILKARDPNALKNVNTPEEMEEVKSMIHKKFIQQSES